MPVLDNATLSTPTNTPEAAKLPPPFPSLIDGSVPAVLVPPITQEMLADPTIEQVLGVYGDLPELGISTYEASDNSTVLYNSDEVDESSLIEADGNGTLGQITAPLVAGAEPPAAQVGALGAETAPPPNTQLNNARINQLAPRPISPIQPDPITDELEKRPL